MGKKKICLQLLFDRIKQLPTIEKLSSVGHALVLMAVIITFISFVLGMAGSEYSGITISKLL